MDNKEFQKCIIDYYIDSFATFPPDTFIKANTKTICKLLIDGTFKNSHFIEDNDLHDNQLIFINHEHKDYEKIAYQCGYFSLYN